MSGSEPSAPVRPFPYDPTDKKCFSYTTVVKRWPVIITNVIDRVHNVNHELFTSPPPSVEGRSTVNARIVEGKTIISQASQLKAEMGRDRALQPIPDDGGPHVELYNDALAKLTTEGRGTWFTCPWLFAECYLYRLMRTWFACSTHWTQFDPFFHLKEETFKGSGAAVYQLALTMSEIDAEAERSGLDNDKNRLEVLFDEMIQMCLWGNATDLSLLTSLSCGDIEKLQSVGKEAQAASRQYILRDDIEAVWEYTKSLKGERLDIVLDNAGFEFFTDLVLADFLVSHTPFLKSVIFHPKQVPWFVSDVTPPDARALFAALTAPETYFTSPSPSPAHTEALRKLEYKWLRYFEDGTFTLNGCPGLAGGLAGGSEDLTKEANGMEFWTRPGSYEELSIYPRMAGLAGSALVIFKGDLNYRKLTGDLRWPTSTPMEAAMGSFTGLLPILSLRTNKADVVVGLPTGVGERYDADPEKAGWRTSGRHGLVTFVSKGSRQAS